MPDFAQPSAVSTIHDLGIVHTDEIEAKLVKASQTYGLGLVLPVTASDMRAEPFAKIVDELAGAEFLKSIVVVLNRAPEESDYREAAQLVAPLGERAEILWTDGPTVAPMVDELVAEDFNLDTPGKGRAVWLAFGYLLADKDLKAFVLHDCDIVNYDREILVRLCLPMAHPSLDFDFCKAYYARCTTKMHGRVVRLLMTPLMRALHTVIGEDEFLSFLSAFRYPLAGEFGISSGLARSNRIPCDWGLEVGTLAEVFRNTSPKRVCQVDLGRLYEHKHQPLSLNEPDKGLMKMTGDILTSIFRTLASRGSVFSPGHFISLRAAYLRCAQDAIRQYHADALMNCLDFDRHSEEQAIEGFAEQITAAGTAVHDDPSGGDALPTWTRVLAAKPDFPHRLREAATADHERLS
ncbi:glycosyltransferase family protein [Adhaeretor mobilis]|uniref:Glucosyl-3-phosphoglycerate synthase n=1 Tax=Adhaeretor mobilis TaxID=1930276 RepID=A0A517MT00_9BACT|nr:glycosyl transferase [Adhaeretor mobilis]QDS98013.1 Glucosyl-3-phosphoglycerate synthase [Adhaeretor mobilis]